MEEACSGDAIKSLRATNREDLSALRKQDRNAILRQRRLTISEVEALLTNITLDQFKEFVLRVKDRKATVEVLKAIKNNCCTSSRSEVFIKTDGALNSLIRILVGRDAQMQLEAAACLTNLACGSHKASLRIAKAAGPYFVSFLGSSSFYLQDQSAWAAGNIVNDCFHCFSLLKSQGLVPALLANLQSPVPDVITSTVFTLNACTKYEDNGLIELTEPHTINLLIKFLNQENLPQSTLYDVAFTLSNIFFLAAKNNIDISNSVTESIITIFCNMVSRNKTDNLLAVPLIRCLGFLSQRYSSSRYLSCHQKLKDTLPQIFKSSCPNLIFEGLWILINISGHFNITPLDIDLNSIHQVIDMKTNEDPSIIHVLYFLCNWISQGEKEKSQLREHQLILKIESLLTCGEKTVENGAKILLGMLR